MNTLITHHRGMIAGYSLSIFLSMTLVFSSGCGKERGTESNEFLNPILATVRTSSPKALTDKSLALINRFDTTGSLVLLAPLFLSGYGYPTYPDVDPDTELTLFYLKGEQLDNGHFILLVKASPEAAFIEKLMQGESLTMKERGEWLILSKNGEAYSLIRSEEELVDIASSPSLYDLEFTLFSGRLLEAKEEISERIMVNIDTENEARKSLIEGSLAVFFQEMDSTQSLTLGLDINRETIEMGMDLETHVGTPLGALVATGSPGRPDGGKKLKNSGSIAFVSDLPTKALVGYLDYLFDTFIPAIHPDLRPDFNHLQSRLALFYADLSGLGASSYSLGNDRMDILQYQEGSLDSKEVEEFYKFLFDDFLPGLGQGEGESIIEFIPRAGTISDTSYHTFRLDMDPVEKSLENQYFAVTGGDLIQTNSLEILESMILTSESGAEPAHPLASEFESRENHWLQGRIHLIQYYRELAENPEWNHMAKAAFTPELTRAIYALGERELEPITFKLTSGSRRISYRTRLPLSTVEGIVEKINEQKNSER